ncbi:MAG: hypothetical protein R3Y13_01465 [bacterium]
MFCERCGSALPNVGYNCPKCGAMMSASQIKMQKKNAEENRKNNSPVYNSANYGVDRSVIHENKHKSNNYPIVVAGIILSMIIFVILVLIIL